MKETRKDFCSKAWSFSEAISPEQKRANRKERTYIPSTVKYQVTIIIDFDRKITQGSAKD